jgi:hypothetical protein
MLTLRPSLPWRRVFVQCQALGHAAQKGVSAAQHFLDGGAARTRERGAAGTRLLAHENARFIVLQGITYTILTARVMSAVPMSGSYERL